MSFGFAYTIVAPHSSHGCNVFVDTSDVIHCTDETIGVFVESVVVPGRLGLCAASGANVFCCSDVPMHSSPTFRIGCCCWC